MRRERAENRALAANPRPMSLPHSPVAAHHPANQAGSHAAIAHRPEHEGQAAGRPAGAADRPEFQRQAGQHPGGEAMRRPEGGAEAQRRMPAGANETARNPRESGATGCRGQPRTAATRNEPQTGGWPIPAASGGRKRTRTSSGVIGDIADISDILGVGSGGVKGARREPIVGPSGSHRSSEDGGNGAGSRRGIRFSVSLSGA